jgi:L-fucose isomerase-like protein
MIRLAYVGAFLPSYLAEEAHVFTESIKGLELLSKTLEFELVSSTTHLSTRQEARNVAEALEEKKVDFVLLQSSSFAMGDIVLEFARRNFKLGLWATQEPSKEGPILLNNFVSMNLNAGILTRYFKEQNIPFKWFYGSTEHKWFKPRLALSIQALRAIKRLQTAKIGLLGGVAPTFYNIAFDERTLLATLGTEVVSHEMAELFTRVKNIAEASITRAAKAMSVAGKVEISERDLKMSAAIYLALKEFAKEHNYDALAVSDWPVFQSELHIHPGMAFSWLDHQEGIPVSSEGDVLGASSMLIMNELNQDKSMLLDMNDIDEERDAVLMWHCGGSPLNFANQEGVSWKNHSTLGRKSSNPPMGAVAEFIFAAQPVTIMRLADDGKQVFVVEADIIESPHRGYDGSRGWLSQFTMAGQAMSLADLVNTIMVEGIEHHFILGKGRHAAALNELTAWLKIRLIQKHTYQDYLQRPH